MCAESCSLTGSCTNYCFFVGSRRGDCSLISMLKAPKPRFSKLDIEGCTPLSRASSASCTAEGEKRWQQNTIVSLTIYTLPSKGGHVVPFMLRLTSTVAHKANTVCLDVYHEFALLTCSSSQNDLTSALLTSRPPVGSVVVESNVAPRCRPLPREKRILTPWRCFANLSCIKRSNDHLTGQLWRVHLRRDAESHR